MRHWVPLIIIVLLIAVTAAGAATRTVPGQYPTIQAAVDAAAPGDTIVIAAGVYSEHVLVNTDSITIRGVNRDTVIIDATQTTSRLPGIRLNSVNGCTIRNLTVRNAALGYVSADVDIEQYGIVMNDSDNNLIDNVRTLNNGLYEIFLWDDSDNNTVQNCILDGYRDASYLSLDGIFSSGGSIDEGGRDLTNDDNVFKCNSISNVVFGFSLTASDSNQILCNTIHAKSSTFWTVNAGYFSYGVNLFASSMNEVRDNVIDTPIIGVRMRDPLLPNSYDYAGPPDNNLVTGNSIDLDPLIALAGVNIRGGSNNDIDRNSISGTGIATSAGVRLDASVDNPTAGNSIFGNDIHGNLIGIQNAVGANSAHYNNIHGNTVFGVKNLDTLNTFDAENNWWGAANGPGPVGIGSGDNVSTFVDFTPFLTAVVPKANVTVQLEGVAVGPFCRDITIHLKGTGPFSPTTIEKCIEFTGGIGTATIWGLPANTAFTCIDAKDPIHTLVSTKTLAPPVLGAYTALFTGIDKLLGGDLQNDDVDDVWDFGIFASQYLTEFHPYLPPQLDADISGNGIVGNEDFLILYSHFLTRGDPPCGMTLGQLPVPKTKITVAQLAALVGGLTNARKADLNQDGYITSTDAQLFYLRNVLNRR